MVLKDQKRKCILHTIELWGFYLTNDKNPRNAQQKNISRAFVSSYLDLGYFTNNKLFLLKLKKQQKVYDVELKNFGYQGSKEVLTEKFSEEKFLNASDYFKKNKQKIIEKNNN